VLVRVGCSNKMNKRMLVSRAMLFKSSIARTLRSTQFIQLKLRNFSTETDFFSFLFFSFLFFFFFFFFFFFSVSDSDSLDSYFL
jgi:hypothetical protein